jgi:pimeloyl-ACP methyl ester carboxylesterase
VDLTDWTLHIPIMSFQTNLYSADLKYYPLGDIPRFVVTGIEPIPSPADRGDVIAVTPLSVKTKEEITAAYFLVGFTASYGVSMNKITYVTIDPFGNPTQASGLIAIPLDLSVAAPLASYQHGTLVEKSESISSPTAQQSGYDIDIVTIMAASGYVVVAPDYLGFGDSSGLHPYVHAKSLAAAVIDMVRSARAYCGQVGVPLNGQLFLGGYSEGGYATMAAHKEMETNYPDEFAVTASAPAAGSYDLSGSMLKRFLSDAPYQEPYFLPYFLLSYDEIYGLADSYADLFAAPYDVSVPPLFDGDHNEQAINSVLPSVPKEMLSPQLLQALEGRKTSVVKTALRENDVYRWTPRAPVRLYHCTGDQLVPYENSVIAYVFFVLHGAPNVELIPLSYGTHENCSLPTYFLIKDWFDSLAHW